MDKTSIKQFQEYLLNWYDSHARVLPWRDNPTPYRVWISEIMLQQTRVDTVKPYFERFMKELPTVEELANVSDDKLLKLWEGLGYYSRAMNLKKAAGIIVESFSRQIPSDVRSLQNLPGIGPYTSGAIASIAFGVKAPAIDGNVLRVMARITANEGDIADRLVKQDIGELVEQLLPEERVGDFNQALMELGATVCLPNGAPKCGECPVQSLCEATKQGIQLELPIKAKKKERRIELKTIFIIEYKDKIAIRQRPDEGLLSSLWEFPNAEGHLSMEECQKKLLDWGIEASAIHSLKSSKHIFTHLEWHMIGYIVSAQNIKGSPLFVWATRKQLKEQYSIPTAFKAYTKSLI